jgi:spermidine/putrescine transport system permease protein
MVEQRSRFFKFLLPVVVGCSYLFLYLPIIVLVLFSFNNASVAIKWEGFTLRWYRELLHSPEILNAFRVSLIVAAASTILSLSIGTCFVFASKWWKRFWLFNIFYTNVLLPDLILAIGILSIFTFLQIPLGYSSLIVGHTLIGLGFVIPIVRARFVELDPILTEASLDLGATHIQTFYKIILPLLMPSLVAAGLLVFTLSLDDFLISFFCSGPTVETLSVYVYSMVRTGIDPTINAISACFLAISSLLVLLLCYFKIIDQVIPYE